MMALLAIVKAGQFYKFFLKFLLKIPTTELYSMLYRLYLSGFNKRSKLSLYQHDRL
jgi:hypothetical protein